MIHRQPHRPASNTVVPALLVLEDLGFAISVDRVPGQELFRATRGDEVYVAENPVTLLGLLELVEVGGWAWRPTEADLHRVLRQYELAR